MGQKVLTMDDREQICKGWERGDSAMDIAYRLGISYYIRPQQTMEIRVERKRRKQKWTDDMWEDFSVTKYGKNA